MRFAGFSLRRLLVIGVLTATAGATGCAAQSDYMLRSPTRPIVTPTAQTATVVFIRPSSYATTIAFTILDGRGRFLGDSEPSSNFAVQVPAGEHLFLAWGENTGPMRANLAPGHTYYVEVAPRMGVFSARVHLLTISPRTESYPNLAEWLSETDAIIPDEVAGQRYLASRKEDVADRIVRANEAVSELDAEELDERTLYVQDGAPAPGVATAAPPPPPVATGS